VLSPLRTIIPRLVVPFVEFVVPPLCFHCGARREAGEQALCASCWQALRPAHAVEPPVREAIDHLCGDGVLDGLVCGFVFEKGRPIQSVLHELKYGGKPSLGVLLGLRLAPKVRSSLAGMRFGGLVPVPLHAAKQRERGYNQSERIAAGISRGTGMPLLKGVLWRRRNTVSQTTLGIDERRENVTGAFSAGRRGRSEAGEAFVLVDDVITSGATVRECARILKRGGASQVVACSVGLAR
jgi:ComF family protein